MSQEKDDDVVVTQKLIHDTPITHVKVSLDTSRQFTDYLNLKFNKNEKVIVQNEVKELDTIIQLGIIQTKKQFIYKESSLLHKGIPPRKDVWKRLGRIASEFLKYNTYPKIEGNDLSKILNISLGKVCNRSITDYRETVLIYCNYTDEAIAKCNDSKLGTLDVCTFVNQIPKQYVTTTSTSSFEVEKD